MDFFGDMAFAQGVIEGAIKVREAFKDVRLSLKTYDHRIKALVGGIYGDRFDSIESVEYKDGKLLVNGVPIPLEELQQATAYKIIKAIGTRDRLEATIAMAQFEGDFNEDEMDVFVERMIAMGDQFRAIKRGKTTSI